MPRRLCLLVFALCAAFCLTALTLPWFGPATERASELLSVRWYYLAVEGSLLVTAAGVLLMLLRALLTPRRRKVVEVGRVDGDVIAVTVAAIAAQASHAIERGGTLTADRVRVRARRRSASVAVRVRPYRPVDVTVEGPRLHGLLSDSLSLLMGDAVDGISIEFVEPAMQDAGMPVHAGDDATGGVTVSVASVATADVPAAIAGTTGSTTHVVDGTADLDGSANGTFGEE